MVSPNDDISRWLANVRQKHQPTHANEVRQELNFKQPVTYNYPKKVRTFSISNEAYANLQGLAASFGYNHHRGGNVSAFMEALGLGVFDVTINEDHNGSSGHQGQL